MGTPTVEDLKVMVHMNLIRNNEITTDDVILAMRAFGPDIGAIKSKITCSKPTPITSNMIKIPRELVSVQENVPLSIDGLK
eukprot:8745996-Ditylum_brightwellii.AAC.1